MNVGLVVLATLVGVAAALGRADGGRAGQDGGLAARRGRVRGNLAAQGGRVSRLCRRARRLAVLLLRLLLLLERAPTDVPGCAARVSARAASAETAALHVVKGAALGGAVCARSVGVVPRGQVLVGLVR